MSLSCSSLSSSAALALVLALCAAPAVHAETASPLPPIGRFFSKPAFAGQQPLRYKARDGQRVPIDHGTRFYNAVKKTNPNVEWVEYPEEGHGFYLPKNSIDFWSRVESFLDQHIGQGAVKQ